MKRLLLFLLLLVVLVAPRLQADAPVYNMGLKDGLNAIVEVDGTLLFYDKGGPGGATGGYNTGFVRFKAKNAGEPLTIEFADGVNFTSSDTHLYIYDGECGYPEGNSSAESWKKPVPEGYKYDLQNGDRCKYTSAAGIIDVLYYAPGSEKGTGWEASLSTVPPKPMEWKGITATNNTGMLCYPGARGTALLKIAITTEGSLQPITLQRLDISIAGNYTDSDFRDLRCIFTHDDAAPSVGDTLGIVYDKVQSALSFVGGTKLDAGINYLWLVADVSSQAMAGNTIKSTLTRVVADGEDRLAAAISPDGSVIIANALTMPAGNSDFTVTGTVNFYDDGGPDGNYSRDFSGTTVFRPGVDGKKVCIDFTSLDLFNTASSVSVGNNDVIKVYNGTAVDDGSLLGTIIYNTDLKKIYSTSPDGALTITFVSRTGTPKGGFESVVDLFEPQAMRIDSIGASGIAEAKVAGGASAPFLLLDLHTVNTEPAVSVTAFSFRLDNPDAVTDISIYSLGDSRSGTPSLIANSAVNGDVLTVRPETPFFLGQSDNYFRVNLTVSTSAVNGIRIGLTPVSVSTPDTVMPFAGASAAISEVSNEAVSERGNKSYTIYGRWTFRNKPSQYSYYAYDGDAGDQVTTFLPGVEGAQVQMDFSKLKLNLGTASYDTPHAVFKVISGTGTTGKVLYEIKWANRNDACPARTFRSEDPSGAITVLFNPNGKKGGTPSSYGFEASVSLYQARNMTLTRAEGMQAPRTVIFPAATDQPVAAMNLFTEGALNPLHATALKVNLKGSADAVRKVKLYAMTDSVFSKDKAILLASDSITGRQDSVAFTFNHALEEGNNYLWIAYDMTDNFRSDLPIDVAFMQVKVGNEIPDIVNADPEGESITKNVYYFKGDDSRTVDGTLIFYDDAGPDGKYTNTHKGMVTFRPARKGDVIKFHFKDFYTNVSDHFYVYDGTGTDTLLANYSSSKTSLPDIVSTASDGCLTVVFNPQKNNTNRGWEIEVTSFTPRSLTVDTITAEAVTPSKILRGSENNIMLHVSVTIGGDVGRLPVDKLQFDALGTTGASLKKAIVYYTGEDSRFGTDSIYATADTSLTFTGNTMVRLPGTYHFWLAYDIMPDATSSSRFEAKFVSLTSVGEVFVCPGRVEASVYLGSGMKGTYTVGESATTDFKTIGAALEALKTQGMEGPVVIEIEDGQYTEHVLLEAVAGNSSVNTLTLRSRSRDRDAVEINYEFNDGGRDYQDKHGVLTLSGINHATVEDLTFTSRNKTLEGIVYVKGYSRFDTLRNCRVHTVTCTELKEDLNLIRMAAINEANRNNDCFNVENCLLEGGYIGLYVGGTSYVALPPERGARIIGNTLRNQGSKGIYLSTEYDAEVRDNTIIQQGYEMATGYTAMDLYSAGGNLVVSGNIIDVKDCKMGTSVYGSTGCGIYVRGNATGSARRRLYNNDIRLAGTQTNTLYALQLNENVKGSQTTEIQHNTFTIEGTGKDYSTAVFINADFGTGNVLRNNIIVSDMTGYAVRFKKQEEGCILSHNSLYSVSDSITGGIADKDYDFAGFNEAAGHHNALNERPAFLSAALHELDSMGGLQCGVPVDYITTDLSGRQRGKETTTLGAYEYSDPSAVPYVADGYPSVASAGYNSVNIGVSSSLAGQVYVLVCDSARTAPTVEQVLASPYATSVRSFRQSVAEVSRLRPNTAYRAYAVARSLRGNVSDVKASEVFHTTYQPTIVSTFENVDTGKTDFHDGTAHFRGFSVKEKSGAPGMMPSLKVAVAIDSVASVTPTNATNLSLTGFFMSNAGEVVLTACDASGKSTAKTIAPGEWRFVNLRDMGTIATLYFACADSLYIDDFSGQPLPLAAGIINSADTVDENVISTYHSRTAGGVPPYTYRWSDASCNALGNVPDPEISLPHSTWLTLSVTDAWGNEVSDRKAVRVTGSLHPATFDDLPLPSESYWNGDKPGQDFFFSGSWELPVYSMPQNKSWAWFGYSNSTDTTFTSLYSQFNNTVGGGFRSSGYGVVYAGRSWGPCVASLTSKVGGDTVPGMYLTNSAWVREAILYGDDMSAVEGGFRKGDWFKLTLTGTRADQSTVEKEIYLADYRDDNAAEHYYLDKWEWIDLRDMGKVTQLAFALSGTKSNEFGMTTPAYVMIDNLGGTLARDTLPVQTVCLHGLGTRPARLSLNSLLAIDPSRGKVSYRLVSGPQDCCIEPEGDVRVMGAPGSDHMILADVRQHGHTSYLAIPVHIDTEVHADATAVADINVWPVPARENINVQADLDGYRVEIYDLGGRLAAKAEGCSNHTSLRIDHLAEGAYVLRVVHPSGVATRKIVVAK